MKAVLLLANAILALAAAVTNLNTTEQFNVFKLNHNKVYGNSAEEVKRFAIFSENLKIIDSHNQRFLKNEVTYTMAVNQFADLTFEEFQQYLFTNIPLDSKKQSPAEYKESFNVKIPKKINWRNKGAVTYIKNQGSCGASWAFATVAALESQYFMSNGELPSEPLSYSVQELLDCSAQPYNGCHSGSVEGAYDYIVSNGLTSGSDYMYQGSNNPCRRANITAPAAINETGYALIKGTEETLKNAVATIGPVVVKIHVTMNFQLYEKGILDDPDCKSDEQSLNHVMLVIGYGTNNQGQDFWLLKNSFGYLWGLDGYIKMSRNKNNQCGIMTAASFPIL